MISEFLAFRYQGVRRIDEILAKPTDFGWKCRKYIKWREVHNSKDDPKALYDFADALMEEGVLRKDLYGAISAIWLNVQKWRLDKEKLSVDPPARKEWDKRDVLFKAARSNPSIIAARLSALGVEADPLTSLSRQARFYAREIDSFFCAQGVEDYPAEPIEQSLFVAQEAELARTLFQRFQIPYHNFGLTSPASTNIVQFLCQIAADLGFVSVILNPELAIPTAAAPCEAEAVVELVPLQKFKIIDVRFILGIPHIRVNSTHPFVVSLATNGALDPKIIAFLKAYGSSMLSMAGSLDTLETFNSYLGLALHVALSPDSTPR
jgi:hypothetical protein